MGGGGGMPALIPPRQAPSHQANPWSLFAHNVGGWDGQGRESSDEDIDRSRSNKRSDGEADLRPTVATCIYPAQGEPFSEVVRRVEDLLTDHLFRTEARLHKTDKALEDCQSVSAEQLKVGQQLRSRVDSFGQQVVAMLRAQAASQTRVQEHSRELQRLREEVVSQAPCSPRKLQPLHINSAGSPEAIHDGAPARQQGEVPLAAFRFELEAHLAENSERLRILEADVIRMGQELVELRNSRFGPPRCSKAEDIDNGSRALVDRLLAQHSLCDGIWPPSKEGVKSASFDMRPADEEDMLFRSESCKRRQDSPRTVGTCQAEDGTPRTSLPLAQLLHYSSLPPPAIKLAPEESLPLETAADIGVESQAMKGVGDIPGTSSGFSSE